MPGDKSGLAVQLLTRREHYLQALVEVQQALLSNATPQQAYNTILPILGQAALASRVYIFHNSFNALQEHLTHQQAEWCAPGIQPEIDNPELQAVPYHPALTRWEAQLSRQNAIIGRVADFPTLEREILEPQGIQSILVLPITVNQTFFGFIGFDNCTSPAPWSPAEVSLLQAAAAAISLYHEQRAFKLALQESEARYRSVVENTAEVIFQLDQTGCWQFLNPAWTTVSGFEVGGCLGKSLSHFLHPDDVALWEACLVQIQQTGTCPKAQELRFITRHKQVRWVALTVQPHQGDAQHISGTLNDITERKEAAIQLQEAKTLADAANKAKSDFLANVSHELRTPLNSILGYAQILQTDPQLNAAQHRAIDIIHRSGTHLLTLINDILDLTKIEADHIELYPTEIQLDQFLDEIVTLFRPRAIERNLTFFHQIHPDLPGTIVADGKRLRQILINLLSNAFKFTPKGQVLLKVEPIPSQVPPHPNVTSVPFRFSVIDTGIGISEDQVTEIFAPFRQSPHPHYNPEGSGLGLTISNRLVQLMDSQLQVASRVGEGSHFYFDVMLGVGKHQPDELVTHQIIIGYEGPRRKILVVDDQAENRLLFGDLLETVGFEILEAETGLDAIQLTQHQNPDLVLIDLYMPEMNGFEVIRRLRNLPERHPTIIAVSADVYHDTRTQSRIAGSDAFIPKPIDTHNLFRLLHQHLGLTWLYQEAPLPGRSQPIMPPPETTLMPPPAHEVEYLYHLALAGDIGGLIEHSKVLEQHYPNIVSFSKHIKRLAREYNVGEIQAFIDQFRGYTPV